MKVSAQIALFNEIRSKLGPNKSLVNEVAELINVSTDSAYRRIRDEKPLTFEELGKLAMAFKISIDRLISIDSGNLLFNYQTLNKENPEYLYFLHSIQENLNALSQIEGAEVMIAAKDFPVFYNFFYSEIAAFKSFFWKKTILQLPEFKQVKFDPDEIDEKEEAVGKKIATAFCRFKTHQLWNEEVFTSFLKQVIYYYESGFINKKSSALLLFDKVSELADHFLHMAEGGSHYLPGKSAFGDDLFRLYQNDVIFGDNTIIVHTPDFGRVYFTHNVIDTLYTHDEEFVRKSIHTHQNIMNRSVLLSKSSERERNRFFKRIRDKIEFHKAQID